MKYTGCLSRQEIQRLEDPLPNTVLVSIRDPGTEMPKIPPKFVEVLYLEFWDTTGGDPHLPLPATLSQITQIYRFLKEHWECNILAHCEAGVSRSGAVREFLARRGWAYFHASQAWRPVFPNSHILSTLERLERGLSPGDSKEFVWPHADPNLRKYIDGTAVFEAPDKAGSNGG